MFSYSLERVLLHSKNMHGETLFEDMPAADKDRDISMVESDIDSAGELIICTYIIHEYIHTYVYMHACMHTYIYIHTYTYTYIYGSVHARTRALYL